jgi:hypothetical protein
MDSLDLTELKVVNADDDNVFAPKDMHVSSDSETVTTQAQPVEPPQPAKGVTVKMLSGTIRTDF